MLDYVLIGLGFGVSFGGLFSLLIGWSVWDAETSGKLSDSSILMALAVAQHNDIMRRSGLKFEPIVYPKVKSKKQVWRDIYDEIAPIMATFIIVCTLGGALVGYCCENKELVERLNEAIVTENAK